MTRKPVDTATNREKSIDHVTSEIDSLRSALEKSEDRYQSFLEEIEDGYIELDLAGRLLFFNSAFVELVGYSREKLKGMSYREYIDHSHLFRVFIANTNRNLRELVAKGIFREDLYYRLKVVEIDIPPLRERREDIQLLVDHFIQKSITHRIQSGNTLQF